MGGRVLFVCSILGRSSLKGIRCSFEKIFLCIFLFIRIRILPIFLFEGERILLAYHILNISIFFYFTYGYIHLYSSKVFKSFYNSYIRQLVIHSCISLVY